MNDPDFRASQLEHDRDEEVGIKMDEFAQKGFSHHMTQAKYHRGKKIANLTLFHFELIFAN